LTELDVFGWHLLLHLLLLALHESR